MQAVWAQPWRLALLVVALVVVATVWRSGTTAVKWFVGLLIVATVLAKWDSLFKPWLSGKEMG